MEIIHNLNEVTGTYQASVIALGTFDGIHIGHRDVIAAAKAYALQYDLKLLVFTFTNHPLSELRPEQEPKQLLETKEKEEIFAILGVDTLVNIPFTQEFAHISPLEFLRRLNVFSYKCLVVGENYNYGFMGKGNTITLQETGSAEGFDVLVRKLVRINETVVSSTNIRQMIQSGEILAANKMLGREYSLVGKVVYGAQRGNIIGFPTANIELSASQLVIPATGVYAVKIIIRGKEYLGMANIGDNPTFGDVEFKRLEVNIFDFSGNIYGEEIKVAFCAYSRGQCKFDNVVALQEQLYNDRLNISKYFEITNN